MPRRPAGTAERTAACGAFSAALWALPLRTAQGRAWGAIIAGAGNARQQQIMTGGASRLRAGQR